MMPACHLCRWSEGSLLGLWCRLHNWKCSLPCERWEYEPGTLGDDD